MKKLFLFAVSLAFVFAGFANPAAAGASRDYISIVGSSTVYPFATVVAEQFGKTSRFKTPKIESTGSGGGLKNALPICRRQDHAHAVVERELLDIRGPARRRVEGRAAAVGAVEPNGAR